MIVWAVIVLFVPCFSATFLQRYRPPQDAKTPQALPALPDVALWQEPGCDTEPAPASGYGIEGQRISQQNVHYCNQDGVYSVYDGGVCRRLRWPLPGASKRWRPAALGVHKFYNRNWFVVTRCVSIQSSLCNATLYSRTSIQRIDDLLGLSSIRKKIREF